LEEHKVVYEAIAAHDPDRSFDAMQRHLEASYKRTLARQVP
jgi:DNA-binding FadR family transcriptional regulator